MFSWSSLILVTVLAISVILAGRKRQMDAAIDSDTRTVFFQVLGITGTKQATDGANSRLSNPGRTI